MARAWENTWAIMAEQERAKEMRKENDAFWKEWYRKHHARQNAIRDSLFRMNDCLQIEPQIDY